VSRHEMMARAWKCLTATSRIDPTLQSYVYGYNVFDEVGCRHSILSKLYSKSEY
jgi:hypothetical protein